MPRNKCPQCGFKIPKATRAPNAYNQFVKTSMAREDVQSLPHSERMKAIALLWKRQKDSK